MTESFSDLRKRSRMVNQEKPSSRFASGGAVTGRAKSKPVVTTGKAAEREMQAMESRVHQPKRRQKLADGGPVLNDPGWSPPNLPSLNIDSSAGRKGATDFRASYGMGDVSASGNYQKATDGGRDSYGGRLTLHKSFAAGGPVKGRSKREGKQRKADGGYVWQTPPWQTPPSPFTPTPTLNQYHPPVAAIGDGGAALRASTTPMPLKKPVVPMPLKSLDPYANNAKRGGRQKGRR
jgi:hypothetical protein